MNTEEKDGASLADLIDVVRRRGRAIGITFAVASWPPACWRSRGRLPTAPPAPSSSSSRRFPTDLVRSTVTSYADQRVQIISQRVMTTQNLLDIIRRYELYQDLQKRESREHVIEHMRDDIRFRMISADVVDPRTGVPRQATIAFTVSYDNPSPDLAVKVANEITSLYLNENLTEPQSPGRRRLGVPHAGRRPAERQIAELEGKLADVQGEEHRPAARARAAQHAAAGPHRAAVARRG